MDPILNKNLFLVKEHTGIFKAANNFDIFDPADGKIIMQCREPKLGGFTKMLRFTKYKRNTPFEIIISNMEGKKVCTIKRGVSLWLSKVQVLDEDDKLIGTFKQKLLSLGGKFDIFDEDENYVCSLKGKWTGWDFKFIKDDLIFASVSKKWAGIGKELFTTADNYMISIGESLPPDNDFRTLIIASVMCIDMVLKE
ncbi:MAG: RNAase [Bacteroidia bacterium]|nr:RNAase [Bacteroidia bacterium]